MFQMSDNEIELVGGGSVLALPLGVFSIDFVAAAIEALDQRELFFWELQHGFRA